MTVQILEVRNTLSKMVWRVHNTAGNESLKLLAYSMSEALHHQIDPNNLERLIYLPPDVDGKGGWAILDACGRWAYLPPYYVVYELPWIPAAPGRARY